MTREPLCTRRSDTPLACGHPETEALERLSALPDGRLMYRLRRRWRDGTTHMVFEPVELVERLAALVPPPRVNRVRYHGVLAPAARDRAAIVPRDAQTVSPASGEACSHGEVKQATQEARRRDPTGAAVGEESVTTSASRPDEKNESCLASPAASGRRRRWIPWAELMRPVFEIDVLECPQCGGALRILAAIHPPETTVAILNCLGLPARPPPLGPAEAEPWDEELDHGLA